MFHAIPRLAAALALALGLGGPAAALEWSPVVGADDLETLAENGEVTVLDIRSAREYATAHIPGAVNAPYPVWRGSAENPGQALSDAVLTAVMQTAGLTPESRVVVSHAGLDETDFGAAARVYWTLKSAGLTEIAILNGGVRGWIAAGGALSVEPTVPKPSSARFTLADTWRADRAAIAEIVSGERAALLLDARPAEFRAGDRKHPAAKRAGTLPGSDALRFDSWFEPGGREIASAERVAAIAADKAPSGAPETVSFCNTGHWAAINWFALSELAGRENVKLYPESQVGWANSGGALATVKDATGTAAGD